MPAPAAAGCLCCNDCNWPTGGILRHACTAIIAVTMHGAGVVTIISIVRRQSNANASLEFLGSMCKIHRNPQQVLSTSNALFQPFSLLEVHWIHMRISTPVPANFQGSTSGPDPHP